jgi:hypothetical protein
MGYDLEVPLNKALAHRRGELVRIGRDFRELLPARTSAPVVSIAQEYIDHAFGFLNLWRGAHRHWDRLAPGPDVIGPGPPPRRAH